jgi:hypothetical protein
MPCNTQRRTAISLIPAMAGEYFMFRSPCSELLSVPIIRPPPHTIFYFIATGGQKKTECWFSLANRSLTIATALHGESNLAFFPTPRYTQDASSSVLTELFLQVISLTAGKLAANCAEAGRGK